MKNTITVNNIVLTINQTQLPFSNNFEQLSAKIVQHEGVDEVLAHVKCTRDSGEPGRTYACYYSTAGKLEGCNTTN
jgi:hypothetical protein